MRAILHRHTDSEFGVFGILELIDAEGETITAFRTAEEDWLDNRQRVSCIAAGHFIARRVQSPRFGNTFTIEGVPNRSLIRIHSGNSEDDVEGCILLGRRFGALTRDDEDDDSTARVTKWAVLDSKPEVERFLDLTQHEESFPFEVRWAAPGSWRRLTPYLSPAA